MSAFRSFCSALDRRFLLVELGQEAVVVLRALRDGFHVLANARLLLRDVGDLLRAGRDLTVEVEHGLLEANGFPDGVADVARNLSGTAVVDQ